MFFQPCLFICYNLFIQVEQNNYLLINMDHIKLLFAQVTGLESRFGHGWRGLSFIRLLKVGAAAANG